MAKKTTKAEENIQSIEEALGKTEQFIEENQRIILIVLGVIVGLVLIYFAYQRFYIQPRESRAQKEMFMAEKYFGQDSLNLALNGDGINAGFLDIARRYRFTKSAGLANYYIGTIYMKQGNYNAAISHFKKFRAKDPLVRPMALGAIGDAYLELGQKSKAVKYYMKAANSSKNEFTTPLFLLKAGWTYEILKDYKNAVKVYKRIQKEFPASNEAREIEKYIARAEGFLKK